MKGILFQPDMVRQIRAKKKRQTRRIMKVQPPADATWSQAGGKWLWATAGGQGAVKCPYGQPGTVLAVREAWRVPRYWDERPPRTIPACPIHFEADGQALPEFGRYRHARFMPFDRSRIHLTLTSVRVERALDITEEDILAEGCTVDLVSKIVGVRIYTLRDAWIALWQHINGPGNPGCWVLQWD